MKLKPVEAFDALFTFPSLFFLVSEQGKRAQIQRNICLAARALDCDREL